MSLKKDSPARPPPPKGLGKKTDSAPSFKLSFKSLEQDEDDEEDLTIMTGELTKKVESDKLKVVNRQTESPKKILKNEEGKSKEIKESKTEPIDIKSRGVPSQRSLDSPSLSRSHKTEPTPSRSASDNKLQKYSKSVDEDGSAMSWFKQNVAEISSAVKDKAERARKRIEEFSENIGKDDENKAKEYKNVSAAEENKSTVNKAEDQHVVHKEVVDPLRSTPSDKLEDHLDNMEDSEFQEVIEGDDEVEEINMVDDFYTQEPQEDFTQSISRASSFPKIQSKKPSLKRRLVKGKMPKLNTPGPVSMSKLSKGKVDEVEESASNLNAKEPNDDSKKSQSTQNSRLHTLSEKVEQHVPSKKFIAVSIFIFLYIIIPLPSYLSGMILGSFLSSLGWISYNFITRPPSSKDPEKYVPVKDSPPMVEPEIKDVSLEDGVTVHKGWMNELPSYDQETYHINKTQSVHVYLDGVTLRLRRPKVGIPKRSMWNEEPIKSVEFIHQRILNLEGSRVFLQPPGLVKKRIWSKKYPICIDLKGKGIKQKQLPVNNESLPESDQGFEILSEDSCDPGILYLFARTSREKEEWYKKFEAACKGVPLNHHLVEVKKYFINRRTNKPSSSVSSSQDLQQPKRPGSTSSESTPQHKRHGSTDSISSTSSASSSPVTETAENSPFDMQDFVRYMGRTMPKDYYTCFLPMYKKNPIETKDSSLSIDCEEQLLWLNALISRCSWDFLHQKYWADKVMEKLQKKLDKIHIPYFIEAFKITDIHLGNEMPVIRRAVRPYLDDQGFWIDLDVNYDGGFKMTIETKVNLMRLKKAAKDSAESKDKSKKSAVTDSDEEDSAESSTDSDEELMTQGVEDSQSSGGKRRFMRYLKKITESKYFQSATDMKYVKKAMEEVSNTPLVLTVECRFLSGTLAVNISPPPTDRIWYGFRGNPKLTLVAKPKVGERRVTVSHITEFIEKKLSIEFQRVLVMPNLDDLVVPILFPEYPTEPATQPILNKTPSNLSTQSTPI